MNWCALDILAVEPARPAVAEWLVRRTGQAVEERDDGTLIGVTTTEAAGAILDELHGRFGPQVRARSRSVPPEDWEAAWRRGLGPRRVGRLVIAPSWSVPDPAGPFTIVIDPETAFGTGEHGSTRAALQLLDRLIRPGDRVLDLGSGSGILSIAAVALGAARAVGIDRDPEAEPIAAANALRNGRPQATFLTGDAADLAGLLGPADLILSNILRRDNEALLPAVRSALAPTGIAIFSGMEESEAPAFREALGRQRFRAVDETVDGGWWGVAVRPE
jgi:ribosomal protein L11 methyltransferase